MNAIVQTLNTAGRAFIGSTVPMLIQSSLLILILLTVDAVLRKRVRAVFRYWIWMLVLVKLVLPPSLWSPVSVGTWFGDTLEVPTAALLEAPPLPSPEEQGQDALATRLSPVVANFLSPPQPMTIAPPLAEPTVAPLAPTPAPAANQPAPIDRLSALSLNWQGFVLLVWAGVVAALLLLLAQRTFFVWGLVAQADEASRALLHELDRCRQHLGLRNQISARVSPNAASPAVCGLWRPVILIPQNLASRLHGAELQAVLFHELAHIQRGDLWINLAQTVLQILYFYNPLLWLANAMIRRIREQAVDEAVLVAMGEAALRYPDTLINVAKLALARRPALSLRLLGVVESKSALTSRIKHILNRPLPRTAKLGLVGVIAVLTTAAILLPMAKATDGPVSVVGINETLDISDKSGHLTIRSLRMTPPDGKRISGTNEASLSVHVENSSAQETYLGLEYYADSGTVALFFSPGASSGVRVLPVPARWQGTLTYPIHYSRFVRDGYIQIRLAKCRDPQSQVLLRHAQMFLSPEAEVLYDKKYPASARDEAQTAEPTDRPSRYRALLPSGVTVELLGACDYPSEGKQWWRPDGSPLTEAPYDGIIAGGATPNERARIPFWLAVRVDNLPEGWTAGIESSHTTFSTSDNVPSKAGHPQDDLRWMLVEIDPNQTTCTARCNVIGPWRTVVCSSPRDIAAGATPQAPVTFAGVQDIGGFMVSVRVRGRANDSLCRILAVTHDGQVNESQPHGLYSVDDVGEATADFWYTSLSSIKEFQLQTRPLQCAEFTNVPLRRGLKTNVEVQVRQIDAGPEATSPAGEDREREIILPEVDRQHVILDLATGELISLPPTGPEPQKVLQALRKLGKGDLLYDCDLGDRTLILLRDATSEQAQGDTGESSIKGYLIGPYLPAVLTVKTAEGRQYKVTILAADDKGCTLQYSPISPDRGASGGAPAAPGKDVEILGFHIAPKVEEVGSELVEKYKQALTGSRPPPGSDFAWFEVRPGTTGAPYHITCEHNGKTYLLLWNDKSHVMLADGTWGLEDIRETTDEMGQRAIILTFDAKGVQLRHALGNANVRHSLAVVFEGRVIAIPFINTTLFGPDLPIIGRFTPEEIQQMLAALKTRLPTPRQTQDILKRRMEEVRPGRVVMMPNGRYTTPVQITEPMVLRGESTEGCIIEVTADQPALLVNTQGKGQVIIENLTIRWQLSGDKKVDLPAALWVKGTNAVIRNCRFMPLGDFQRSPMAVYFDRPSQSTVDNCRFSGFDYVVCYGQGTEGVVQDCLITDCGHQGVINYDGATLTVQRNIITGSRFHAVRCTGGILHVKDNLLLKNANRGIYLGNRTGQGTITNNLIMGNGSGISGFGRANYVIANNVIAHNSFSGIDMRDSCRFSIHNNVLVKNQRGLALFKEGTENFNVVGKNACWANATDVENLEKPAGSLTADPQFVDPNHSDFTVQGAVRAQEHGLTNPQILRDLWQRYEQLRTPSAGAGQPQASARTAAATAANNAADTSLAWQRTDRYVPPDPNGFFPDDPEAGKKLDALYQAVDKDQRSDEEILSTVRQGFRRATQSRESILAWIGNRYIWNKDPQNPQAVEILYQAVPLEQPSAVYYGLSVLRHKPANVLRTMADICMRSRSDEVGRITWGLGPQREALIPYLTPYLQDQDAGQRELAGVLVKNFKGELDFDQWRREKLQEQLKARFAGRLPQFNQTLLTGDSNARYQALMELLRAGGLMVLDDSALPALQAAGADPDRRVRNEVAQLVGNRWVWAAQKQDPNAIALMVRLGADSDHDVRYNAVYFGLSVVREKGEPVVRRLVELALTDHEDGLYSRIVWGLRTFSRTAPDPFARILAENLGRAKTDAHHAACVYGLHRDVLEKEPPEDWGLAQVRRQYPEDLFVLPFSAREPFQPENPDALWSEFSRALPEGTAADRLPTWNTNKKDICYARIRGKEQTETVQNTIANHPHLRAGEVRPLPLATQLYLEEKYGTVMPQKNQPRE